MEFSEFKNLKVGDTVRCNGKEITIEGFYFQNKEWLTKPLSFIVHCINGSSYAHEFFSAVGIINKSSSKKREFYHYRDINA